MELITVNNTTVNQRKLENEAPVSKGNFIEANTHQVTLNHLKNECIIPVYCDNEITISHAQFIEATRNVVIRNFRDEKILLPNIRTSHLIKGRVSSALGKSIKELTPQEITIYYQRCAFMIEVSSITEMVNGNTLTLVIGGVRAMNQENLYSKRNLEKFKVFIGFKNSVCTNLCINTDGLKADIRVANILDLEEQINGLINQFNRDEYLASMERLSRFYLDEVQFAHLVGKMRMYLHLQSEEKVDKLTLTLTDNQIGVMVKNYYRDQNFSRSNDKKINLWNFYNLMTEANKSSYIDSNLERNVGSFDFVSGLANSIEYKRENWFLH